MRYSPISKELFIKNRKRFSAMMKPNSVAVFHSNDIMPTNGDGVMPFKQNSDLYYLSGIDQEQSILVLFPDAHLSEQKEILFVKETSEFIKIWEGQKLTKEDAVACSGIENVLWISSFEDVLKGLLTDAENVYVNFNEHSRAATEVQTRDERNFIQLKNKYPLHHFLRSAPLLRQLRYVKSELEIETIQKACDITDKAFRRILKSMKAGKWEYEIEADITHEFLINGSRGHAYQPIIASGQDSCVLHYIDNDKIMNSGDLVLMDFGAEYANYNADLTRTIPVNGKYTPRQKEVYNAVLSVMKNAKEMLVPSTNFKEYNKEIGVMMESALIDLKLLDKKAVENQDPLKPLYRQYFMHGTSHSLGLDVHDVDDRSLPFVENMVFTCEPGIYIPKENIGVRIENDLVVKPGKPFDLMANIPIEIEEIESLMNE